MDIRAKDEWERLGTALRGRRGQLGYGSRERKRFAADTGLHYRTVQRLETGEREGYPPETIAQAETAYRLAPNAIGAFFTTGVLEAASTEASDRQRTLAALDLLRREVEAGLVMADPPELIKRYVAKLTGAADDEHGERQRGA